MYRTHTLFANRTGRTVEFKVVDITGSNELFIDDILIAAIREPFDDMFTESFDAPDLNPMMSISQKCTYTLAPGFRTSPLLGGGMAWGFGRSDSRVGALDNYVTRIVLTLPEPRFIKAVLFKEAEQDTNWGNQGSVYVDDTEVPKDRKSVV